MSKDIWHIADITPDPCRILICKTNKGQNYTAIIPSPQEWNTMILPEFYSLGDIDNAERIEQYAYLDDLLALETENKDLSDKIGKLETELEHTRKALEMTDTDLAIIVTNLDKVFPDMRLVFETIRSARKRIAEITALEQKEQQ